MPAPLYYIFFIANFYTADHVFFLKLLWTISVEEQFYLLWGFFLRFFYKNLSKIIVLLFITSISFSLYSISNGIKFYFNTLTYLFDFGSGGLTAYLIFNKSKIVSMLSNFNTKATFIFYSYLFLHFFVFYFLNKNTSGITNDIIALASRYIFIVYVSLFIIEQMMHAERTKIFERNRFLIFTGKNILRIVLLSWHYNPND